MQVRPDRRSSRGRAGVIAITFAGLVLTLTAPTALAHEGREVHGFELVVGFVNEPAFEGLPNGVSLVVEKPAPQHTHGELFTSTPIKPGGSYELTVTHELAGQTISYHSHLVPENEGVVTVSHDAPEAGVVEVAIEHGANHPREITVRPGTTIVWVNQTDELQTVTSGFHTSADAAPGQASHAAEEEQGHVAVTGLEVTLQVEVTHAGTGDSTVRRLRPVFGADGAYAADLIPTVPGQYSFRFFGSIEGEDVDELFESGPGTFDDVQDQANLHFPLTLPSARELTGVVEAAQRDALDAQGAIGGARALGLIGLIVGAGGLAVAATALIVSARRRG